ncbi:alpha/beta hydrolase [Methylobrevis pamukkalensis]|nr:alpha/beta hydrolase [Methylobrevis pamukkalensis]
MEQDLKGRSGLRIHVRSWLPPGPPKAVLALCHGLNSHGGQYAWFAGTAAAEGFAVHALDLRGRGRSEGRRWFVRHIDEYVEDLADLVRLARAEHPGLPVFLLGHSAGGVTATTYVLDNQHELAGFICESYALDIPAPRSVLTVLKGIAAVLPRLPVFRLKNEDFSRDPNVVAALNTDPLTANEIQPAATVAALARAGDRIRREFERITLPVLILHGTADRATLPSGSRQFFERTGSADKRLKLYEGHFHDLLADVGRETVAADILGWIQVRLSAAANRGTRASA